MTEPSRSSRQKAKDALRRVAIRLCGIFIRFGSRVYEVREQPTLVIAPHQDDETLACGGIIARKRNEGLPVHVVFITDGSASHPHHPRLGPQAISDLRTGEAKRALACLGVERSAVHFLQEPDGTLKAITSLRRENLVNRLADLLHSVSPAEIFLPCNPDGSSEHDAVFGFVIEAVTRSGLQPEIWQYPVWSWWTPVLLVRRWLATDDCRRLPLEDYSLAKQQAIECYQSQIAPLAPDTTPALPANLVKIFLSDAEFFFRYRLPGGNP